ncbi:MAG TPA: RNA polymerase sigma factor, partial [Candidatus Limnocylindrales bacterium]
MALGPRIGADDANLGHAFERHRDWLVRRLAIVCGDAEEARDLCQETFLRAFANLGRFQPGTNFAAWIYRIGHNAFANQCRAARKREPLPDDLYDRGLGPVEEAVGREAAEDVARALQQLPTDYR